MEIEKRFAEYITDTVYDDLPAEPLDIMKTVILTVLGTTVGGATVDVSQAVLEQVREWGGKEEATILIHGGRAPAHNAAFINSVMARALDFCDAAHPGIHIGSSQIPAALAAAELAGGCSGKEFLTAVTVGTEVAHKINQFSFYNGFDPSGICGIFSATATAGRILGLSREQMLHALAIAFNKAAGSMQSNVQGALSVVLIQGFTSQGAIVCSQLARRGMTGPKSFLTGTFGYFHLFNNDKYDTEELTGGLGTRFELTKTLFKRYSSCGLTQSSTYSIHKLIRENDIAADDIERIDITVGPFVYNMVGQPHEIGDNPKINAQYCIPFCVANALLRRSSRLRHFDEDYIRDLQIMPVAERVHVAGDPALESRGLGAMRMQVRMKNGEVYSHSMDFGAGSPERTLNEDEHMARFRDCISYGGKPLPQDNVDKLVSLVKRLEDVEDIRRLIPLMMSEK
ncbi:MmgE/PrpD family protein [Chloroflexota bacterium]